MGLPWGNRISPSLPEPMQQQILSRFEGEWAARLEVGQMFVLIDGILPFEACLYYQVLPLFLDGNRLNLGMVSPEDSAASDYVRRIISYLNYSLVSRPIASDALQIVLSAYLNHVNNKPTAIAPPPEGYSFGHHRHSTRARAEQQLDPNDRRTLVVDSPDQLTAIDWQESAAAPASTPVDSAPVAPPAVRRTPAVDVPQTVIPPQNRPSLLSAIPELKVQPIDQTRSLDSLTTLAPDHLLQELLGRMLLGGIGRLYLERHAQHGRILWSQNGVLQSVLDRLPLPLFQGVIDTLKQLAGLPVKPLSRTEQAETERLYERTRLLLRFRFIPAAQGEEATVQVLRGAALKFYQQQQLARLERDAIGIAQQLQHKLNEIRDRAQAETGAANVRFESLPALSQLLQVIEQQLEQLESDEPSSPE